MSLVVMEAQRHALSIKTRLRNPPNAVPDFGIDLKRKAKPIQQLVAEPNDVFGPILPSEEELAFGPKVHPAPPPASRIEQIQRAVVKRYGITRMELLSSRRTNQVVRPRQIAMYLCKMMTPRSLPEIGRRFGGKDHTTVLHAVRKIEARRSQDPILDGEILGLIEMLSEPK